MKKVLAVLLTLAMLLAFASCGSKETPADVTADETSEATENVTEETAGEADVTEESATAEITEKAAEEETSEDASEAESEESSEAETSAEKIAVPETKEEIIALYNSAVNSAYDARAGFSKERYTDNEVMDMSVALKPFKSLVQQFVGIGEDNKYTETVEKGKWNDDEAPKRHFLRKSTLSSADVTNAKCEEDGKYLIVTLDIKNGNSHGGKENCFTNAPVDKCGICTGKEDKGFYDHKTGEVIYSAISGTYEGADITESYKNAKAVAKIDAETGKLVALTVTFDITVAIDISIGSGTASGTTHIIYKDFKY